MTAAEDALAGRRPHVPAAVLLAASVVVSGAGRLDGSPLALTLVWPAAAVACLWLATARTARDRARTLLGIVGVMVLVGLALGENLGEAAGLAVPSAAGALVTVWVAGRCCRRPDATPWSVTTIRGLGVLHVAALAGSVVTASLWLLWLPMTAPFSAAEAFAFLLVRNTSNTVVIVFAVLHIWPAQGPRPAASWSASSVVCFLAGLTGYAAVFLSSAHLPTAWVVLPFSAWVATRLNPLQASVHLLLVGPVVVMASLAGWGPFGAPGLDIALRAALAEGFLAVLGILVLLLVTLSERQRALVARLSTAQAEAEERARELEEMVRRRMQFMATMSHEIRTPLHGVLGLLRLLHGSRLGGEQERWVAAAASSGEAMLSLVNEVLDLSKIEAGSLPLRARAVEIAGLVDAVVAGARAQVDPARLDVTLDVAPGVGWREVDAGRFRQVVANVIGNAAKFTVEGTVRVRVLGDEDSVSVVVADTGPGMAPEELADAFAPYVQLAAGRDGGGSGLGLTIARELARAMGGDVTLTAVVGVGTTALVRVAAPTADPVEAPAPPARVPSGRLLDLPLLVVDDDLVNQLVARAALEQRGARVLTAADGDAALRSLAGHDVSAILVDLQMPGMGGLELARRVRRLEQRSGRPPVPLVAMTASAFDSDRRLCREAGMDGFLPKPWTTEELDEVLAALVEKVPRRLDVPAPFSPVVPRPAREGDGRPPRAVDDSAGGGMLSQGRTLPT